MLCDRMDVEKPQIFLVCNFFKKNSKNFLFSSPVKEYLTLGSLFAIFEPWIWRRLGPVPACFSHIMIRKLIRDFNILNKMDNYISPAWHR